MAQVQRALRDNAKSLAKWDAPADSETMHGLQAERLENEHIQCALDDVGIWLVHGILSRRLPQGSSSS